LVLGKDAESGDTGSARKYIEEHHPVVRLAIFAACIGPMAFSGRGILLDYLSDVTAHKIECSTCRLV